MMKKIKVKTENLKSKNISSMILLSEESRRMMELRETYKGQDAMLGMFGNFEPDETLVLNKNNSLIQSIITLKDKPEKKDYLDLICKQVYSLALMSYKNLSPKDMTEFIERSNTILEKLSEIENN